MIQLYNGDCLEVMKNFEDNSVDMVFTDLPFLTTKARWDCPVDLDLWWKEVKRIRRPGAAVLHFCQVPFNITLGASNME